VTDAISDSHVACSGSLTAAPDARSVTQRARPVARTAMDDAGETLAAASHLSQHL
jgi:hypothetical protein